MLQEQLFATSTITGSNLSGTNTGDNADTTGNAGSATNIQSANQSSDTTCFPLFITNSGTVTLQAKNNVNFTFNASTAQLGVTSIALTGLTQGSIPFIGSAGVVSQDNSNLFWDDTNNGFAIGTNAIDTTSQLTIQGANNEGITLKTTTGGNTDNLGIKFQNTGTSYTWHMYRKDAGSNRADLVFANGASATITSLTDVVTFQDGGNVGIATPDPTQIFDVRTDTHNEGIYVANSLSTSTTNKSAAITFGGTNTSSALLSTGAIICAPDDVDYVGSSLTFFTRASSLLSNKMTLTSAGILGIGTNGLSSPSGGQIVIAPSTINNRPCFKIRSR